MYLSRMELDTTKRRTIMAMASPAIFHGAVESSCKEKGGKLWRIDSLGGKQYLLLLTAEKPDLSAAVAQFGAAGACKTLDYSQFLDNLRAGERRRFRLKANPVVSKSEHNGKRGKVFAHVTAEQQGQWLLERSEKNGFKLKTEDFMVVQSKWESFRKGTDGGRQVFFHAVIFEGLLTISDPELFRQTLQNGLGREKAYGCGMMTVTRCLHE